MLKKIAFALVATTLLTAPVLAQNSQPNHTPSTATAPAGTSAQGALNGSAGKATSGTAQTGDTMNAGKGTAKRMSKGAAKTTHKHRHAARHTHHRRHVAKHSHGTTVALHKGNKAHPVRVSHRVPHSSSATRSGT